MVRYNRMTRPFPDETLNIRHPNRTRGTFRKTDRIEDQRGNRDTWASVAITVRQIDFIGHSVRPPFRFAFRRFNRDCRDCTSVDSPTVIGSHTLPQIPVLVIPPTGNKTGGTNKRVRLRDSVKDNRDRHLGSVIERINNPSPVGVICLSYNRSVRMNP